MSAYSSGGVRSSKITNCLLYFICKDNRPFEVVKGKGFVKLMKELVPLYSIPSTDTLKRRMDEKYESMMALYKQKISCASRVCVTCDIWSEMMTTKSFLGVTVHFIESQKLVSLFLCAKELRERHKAEYISNELKNIMFDWDIPLQNIMAVVTDNAANMASAINSTVGKNRHLSCFAHSVNLVAECVAKDETVDRLICKVREIVKCVKSSVILSDELRKQQMKAGKSEGQVTKLILDVKTRWNSVYYMLNRFIELAPLLSDILLVKPDSPPMPTAVELAQLKEYVTLLGPLEYITRQASEASYITISRIIPLIKCLIHKYKFLAIKNDKSKILKEELEKEIKKRFGNIEGNANTAIATILDPRFKTLHFEDPLACSKAISILRQSIGKNVTRSSSETAAQEPSGQDVPDEEKDFWSHHQSLVESHSAKKRSDTPDEVSEYLAHPVADLSEDPLQHSETMKYKFPKLYQEAQKFFCIVVATSVPAERLFSKAGATITQARNCLMERDDPNFSFWSP